jgi:hypothetical protein
MSVLPPLPKTEEPLTNDGIYPEENPTEVPKVLRDSIIYVRPPVDCGAPVLTKEEYEEAKKILLKNEFSKYKFPRSLKTRVDPPITGQTYSLHTFIPSPGATPDSDGVFGILKNRGNFPSREEADEHSEMLIRKIDSWNEIFIGFVGKEFPLTLKGDYCKDTKEVDVRNKLDEVALANLKKKREKDQKDLDDIKEREAKLLEETKVDKMMAKDDIEYYTTLRVKFATLCHTIEDLEKRYRDANKLASEARDEIKKLNSEHADYSKQYIEKYTKALTDAGIDVKSNPLVKHMTEEALEQTFINELKDKIKENV